MKRRRNNVEDDEIFIRAIGSPAVLITVVTIELDAFVSGFQENGEEARNDSYI